MPGGKKGEFEELREAREVLVDAGKRLEAWLGEKGVELAHSGAVSGEVGEMYVRVGEVTNGVDVWLAEGEGEKAALAKALWQKKGIALKKKLEELLGEVEEWEGRLVGEFGEIEERGDLERALVVRGELGFLRKWRAELRGRYGKIWEGLV